MATDTKSKNPALDFSQQEIDAQIKEREEIERLNSQFRSPSATPEQPIIPPEDANGENYSGRGDTELGDTEPSGDNEKGSQPSGQIQGKKKSKLGQKAKQRIDDWKKKTADKAKQKAKDAAKKAGKKALKKLGKKAAVEGAKKAAEAASSETVVAPILIELADKALQLAKIGVKALATGRYEEGISEATKSVSKPIKIALLILGGCFLLFFLIIVMIFGAGISTIGGLQEQDRLMKLAASNATGSASLTIIKNGPPTANKGDELTYSVTVTDSEITDDIILTDVLPVGTTYVPTSPLNIKANLQYDPGTNTVTWSAKKNNIPVPVNTTFNIVLKATTDKSFIVNIINGIPITTTGAASNISNLLPQPLPADTKNGNNKKQNVLNSYSAQLITVYKQAEKVTNIPWQVLGGIHFREGLSLNTSLVSGRAIGVYEPDVPETSCPSSNPQGVADGKPELLKTHECKFSSLLDTAIYAGNHLKGKIDGVPQTFQKLVEAVSRYNGGGNRNCGRGRLAPNYRGQCLPTHVYPHLIAPFYGDDDDYAMNLFDDPHDPMYIIYCGDHAMCKSATLDPRPGVVTVIKWLSASSL